MLELLIRKTQKPLFLKLKKIKIMKKIIYRLFLYIKDLKIFLLKNKNQSNYIYLLYWFISYFNYIKELNLYK